MKRIVVVALVALALGLPMITHAQYSTSSPLTFEALNQNMWGGSGPGSTTYEHFLGVEWPYVDGSADLVVLGTGVRLVGSTHGRIGLDLGARINAGRVDVTVPGNVSLSTDRSTYSPGGVMTIGTGFGMSSAATMATEFPSLEVWADLAFDVYAHGGAEFCLTLVGCTPPVGGTLIDFNIADYFTEEFPPELFSFNRDGSDQLRALGLDLGAITGTYPLEFGLGPIEGSIQAPDLHTSTTATSTSLTSSGEAQVLEVGVDVPRAVADFIYPGAGCLLSCEAFGFGYALMETFLGPRFGIGQEFMFNSTPMVTLDFSAPLTLAGGGPAATSFSAPLGSSLEFLYPDALSLDVTPTYWLNNSLNVDTDMLARLAAEAEFLTIKTIFGNLGPLWATGYVTPPLSIGMDDRTFALDFNDHTGSTFTLTREIAPPIDPTVVPEPSTWVLVGSGLLLVGVMVRRRERWGDA
jgi:hypothetical protein